MTGFLIRRLIGVIPTLLITSIFIFALLRMVPGDPAALLLGDVGDDAQLAAIREQMGLDRPLPIQYLIWLKAVATGDLGTSFMTGDPVGPALLEHFWVTAQVVGIAFVLAAAIALPAGILAARHRGRTPDNAIVATATLFLSVPSFWVGMLLIMLFGEALGWLPTMGFVDFSQRPSEWLLHIVMPVVSLVFVEAAILTRLMRASTIEVLSQDYIAYARAKGIPERAVLWRHTVKNALSPTLTMLGLILGSLLSGAAVIETIFGLPGLGRFLVDAIYARDYPVVQGTLLFIVLIYITINIAVDLIYPLLDPRVRAQ